MADTPSMNGTFSQVFINGVRYTCVGIPSFSAPIGTSFLPIAGAATPYLVSKGMIEPVITMTLLARDLTADSTLGNPLSTTFLSLLLGRSAIPFYDASAFGVTQPGSKPGTPTTGNITDAGVAFTDGASITLMYGTKIASMRISGSKSGVVTVQVTIVGSGFYQWDVATSGDTIQTRIQGMMPTTGQCANPLWFTAFTFNESALADKVFNFDLSYSNNLDPNRALNGQFTPSQQNAMNPSGTLSLTLQALDGIPGDHTGASVGTATLVITNPAATKSVSLQCPNLKSVNPYSRPGMMGRILRTYPFLLAGDCNNLNVSAGNILVASSSTF